LLAHYSQGILFWTHAKLSLMLTRGLSYLTFAIAFIVAPLAGLSQALVGDWEAAAAFLGLAWASASFFAFRFWQMLRGSSTFDPSYD
jgi:hypothetical protein